MGRVLAAVGVGAALRIAWSMYAARSVPEFFVSGDQYSYWVIGQEIAAGRGYRIPPFTDPTSYYPVGFPALLGLVAFITQRAPLLGDPVLVMAAVQITAGVAAIWLTAVIAERLWGRRVAVVSAWMVALWPNLIIGSATYSIEPVFIALTLAVVAVLVTHDWSTGVPSTPRLVAFGAMLGLTVLVRPFIAPVVVGLAVAAGMTGAGWRAVMRTVAVPLVVVAVALVPWTVRNAIVLDAFVPISTNLGDTLCMDRALDANGTFRFADHQWCADPDLPEVERNRENIRLAVEFVVTHPGKEVQLWGMRLFRMMSDDRVALREVEELGAGLFLPDGLRTTLGIAADTWFFAVGSLCLIGVLRRRRALVATPERVIVLMTAVGLLLIPVGLWGAQRFHVPLSPFMAMGAALAIAPIEPGRRRVAGMDAVSWDERYAAAELVWSAEPNRFVVEVFDGRPPGRVVDVACGEGRNAIWLAKKGWSVTGADFSAVAIERARTLAAEAGVEVDWRVDDATTWQPDEGMFDAVLLCYLQLPAEQLAEVMARARAALAPGGEVVVIAHARDNLTRGVGGPRDPAVLPTPDEVVGYLDGLEVRRAGHVLRPVQTPDGEREAVDLLVVARRPGDEPVPAAG